MGSTTEGGSGENRWEPGGAKPRRSSWLLVWLLASLPGVALADRAVEVKGRVVDADGNGVPDVRVAQSFTERLGTMTPADHARTDASGRYRLQVHLHNGASRALMAIDVDELRGGIAPIRSGVEGGGLVITLGPLSEVRGTLLCEDLGGPRKPVLLVMAESGGAAIASTSRGLGSFTLRLPAGSYTLTGSASADHGIWQRTITVADGAALDLEDVLIAGAPHTEHLGQSPPAWSVGAARNLSLAKDRDPTTVKEEDFDGRWLAVGFVDARTAEGKRVLQELAQVWKANGAHRDRLAVVVFHAPWAKTFAQVDERAGKLGLPFPSFLDPSGKTYQSWKIGSRSRILLLDPEGRLQRWDKSLLFKRLRR